MSKNRRKDEEKVPHATVEQLACIDGFECGQLEGWMKKHKGVVVAVYVGDVHRVFEILGFYDDIIYVDPFDSLPSLISANSNIGKCLKHGKYKVVNT